MTQPCSLCDTQAPQLFHEDINRRYLLCRHCGLVFVPRADHLSLYGEKARYDQHHNDVHDPGYRRFLSRALHPLQEQIPPPAHGLDFGCGPGPALALMCQEEGYTMAVYDPFYAPEVQTLQRQYDFITCTEVVEHLRIPGQSLSLIWSLLRPGGWVVCMTKLVQSQEAFSSWHYIRDETHISFFSRTTFRWLAEKWQARLHFQGADVILLQKPLSPSGSAGILEP